MAEVGTCLPLAYTSRKIHTDYFPRITKAFTKEQAADVTEGVWTRLGMSPTDKKTWTSVRTNMPHHRTFDASEFAPRAWAAICELVSQHPARPPLLPRLVSCYYIANHEIPVRW